MKHLLIYLFAIFTFIIKSQNFVPNGSFENYINCPTAATFYEVTPWCGLAGGEEAYNKCFTDLYGSGGFGVPENTTVYQYPRTGNGFGSVLLYTPDPLKANLREYLHVPLINLLQANKTYCGTFYVNLINECKYATDKIGMALTSNFYPCNQAMPNPQAIPTIIITPQVQNPSGNLITDTLNWIEVSGTFTSTGTEAYLTIGNFYNDANTPSNLFNSTAPRTILFLLIDDVSVEEIEIAKTSNDTLIYQGDSLIVGANNSEAAIFSWQPTAGLSCTNCPNPKASPTITTTYTVTKTQCKSVTTDVITVSVSPVEVREISYWNEVVGVSPNPTTGNLTIAFTGHPELVSRSQEMLKQVQHAYTIKITDVLGKETLVCDYKEQLDISYLENGIYFLSLYKNNQLLVTKKIIKQ